MSGALAATGAWPAALSGEASFVPLSLGKPLTQYERRVENGRVVLRASSERSASAMVCPVSDPPEVPTVEWRWKIERGLDNPGERRREGDDYAARLFVLFGGADSGGWLGWFSRIARPPGPFAELDARRALSYVWASHVSAGTSFESPVTSRVVMVVLRSGDRLRGEWTRERRMVSDDYRRAFGEAPPPVVGLALMSDTDDTVASAVAWYGDVRLRGAPGTAIRCSF